MLNKSIETCEQAWNFALPYFQAGWAKFQVCLHVAKSLHVKNVERNTTTTANVEPTDWILATIIEEEAHVFHEQVLKHPKRKPEMFRNIKIKPLPVVGDERV